MYHTTSFKEHLTSRYGAASCKVFSDLVTCADKRARTTNHVQFNIHCRDYDLTPKWATIRNPLPGFWRSKALCNRTSNQLVTHAITCHKKDLRILNDEHCCLLEKLSGFDDNTRSSCMRFVNSTYTRTFQLVNRRQDRKLTNLLDQQVYQGLDPYRNIVNLSSLPVSKFEAHVLNLGLDFNCASPPNLFDHITALEVGCSTLPYMQRNEFRSACASKLSSSKAPSHNLSIAERRTLAFLRRNRDRMFLPADKGHSIVIMDSKDYDTKMNDLLSNPIYSILPSSPFKRMEANVKRAVQSIFRSGNITRFTRDFLCKNDGRVPQLYGSPKVHKPGTPLRPIISQCGTPAFNVAKYLCPIITPLLKDSEHIVKDSFTMADFLRSTHVPADYIMISLDVVNLFTCTPVDITLDILRSYLSNDTSLQSRTCLTVDQIMDLTKCAVSGNAFQVKDKFFSQSNGLAMGSPISPVLSNLYMMDFETKVFQSLPSQMPHIVWKRYVDDIFVLCHKDYVSELFHLVNTIDPVIKFTIEYEKSNQLSFLDILIFRNRNTLDLTIFRKPYSANQLLHFRSAHHRRTKFNLVQTLTNRILRICSPLMIDPELERLIRMFRQRGYPYNFIVQAIHNQKQKHNCLTSTNPPGPPQPKHEPHTTVGLAYHSGISEQLQKVVKNYDIRLAFKANNTIKRKFTPKTQATPTLLATNVVYKIDCSCGEFYIGETKRQLGTRVKEHERAFRNRDVNSSAIAQHALGCQDPIPQPLWNQTQVVTKVPYSRSRKLREALEINKYRPSINRDSGVDIATPWRTLIAAPSTHIAS